VREVSGSTPEGFGREHDVGAEIDSRQPLEQLRRAALAIEDVPRQLIDAILAVRERARTS